jgi:hypothetical protein
MLGEHLAKYLRVRRQWAPLVQYDRQWLIERLATVHDAQASQGVAMNAQSGWNDCHSVPRFRHGK